MKSKLLIYGLRLIPEAKRQLFFIRAVNFLTESNELINFKDKVTEIRLVDSNLSWCFVFDGQQFLITKQVPKIIVYVSIADVLHFASTERLKEKVTSGKISVIASEKDKQLIIGLLQSINPVRVSQCVSYLRSMFGLKDSRIEDKALGDLTIRDIASEADIDYVRDQALAVEGHCPALALHLMHLAHAARPKGPFIRRKLDEYRAKEFDRIGQHKLRPLEVIPVVEGKMAYFPLPKVACSSIKTALYEFHHQRVFDSCNYNGQHVHDYWRDNMLKVDDFARTIIVVRDPIERFLSAYSSRVLDYGELNRAAIAHQSAWMLKSIPHFRPSLSQFIEHLDVYLQVPSISHHCQTLATWVNGSLASFSDIIPMSNMVKVQELLNEVTQTEVLIPRNQVGKNRVQLEQLSRRELDFLLRFYQCDYELLAPWYSQQAVIKKWKSRQQIKV